MLSAGSNRIPCTVMQLGPSFWNHWKFAYVELLAGLDGALMDAGFRVEDAAPALECKSAYLLHQRVCEYVTRMQSL